MSEIIRLMDRLARQPRALRADAAGYRAAVEALGASEQQKRALIERDAAQLSAAFADKRYMCQQWFDDEGPAEPSVLN